MPMSALDISGAFSSQGFVRIPGLFQDEQLDQVLNIVTQYHERWLLDNEEHYQNGVVNSAYLTGTRYLNDIERQVLFDFIGSRELSFVLDSVLPNGSMFINTQLFFDPADSSQKNYWHRDIQYNNLSVEDQIASLATDTPLHLRVALKSERGVELIPGSHKRWDSDKEFAVRMASDSHEVFDDLESGVAVALKRGDALLFSAAMIHRGLYGGDRCAFDLLFANKDARFTRLIDPSCLPDSKQMASLHWSAPFEATRELLDA